MQALNGIEEHSLNGQPRSDRSRDGWQVFAAIPFCRESASTCFLIVKACRCLFGLHSPF
jgi:hypothetical protein